MNEPTHELEAYFAGHATEEQLAIVEAWINADQANAKAFMEQLHFREMVGQHLREKEDQSSLALAELARLEDQAEPMTVTILDTRDWKGPGQLKPQWHAAGRYLFEHYVAPRVMAIAAIAAALVIAVTLAIVFLPGGNNPQDIAHVPATGPTEVAPVTPQVVATITEQYVARWVTENGEGALPDQMLLGPNRRLTLSRGFAEVTTQRGAKMLVQAPATIETTTSLNAIRLHRGKLVGTCETDRSKGFVVHAPGMDVVDLGTVFGVEADATNGSSVKVIEGSVLAQSAPDSPRAFEPVVLKTDQARRVVPETGQLEAITVSQSPVFHPEPVHRYIAAVFESKPVAYWRFEGQASQSVENEIDPRRAALQANGSVRLDADGLLGQAGRFDNTDNTDNTDGYYLTTEPFDAIGPDRSFAIELWVWIGQELDQVTGSGSLVGLFDTQSELFDHVVHIEIQPQDAPIEWRPKSFRVHYEDLAVDQDGESQVHGLFSDEPYEIGRWHHVVINHESGRLRLFVDGQLAGTIPAEIDPVEQPALVLGRSMRLKRFLRNSKIDEVAFYDRAMTQDEIQSHRQAMQPPDQARPNP